MTVHFEKRISAGTLRLIAMASMLIDHAGAAVIYFMMNSAKYAGGIAEDLYLPYRICRCIGRLALPIFVFLLTEGFIHTSDRKRYVIRLLAAALISEIPFDLAIFHQAVEMSYQNVIITLLVSLLMLIAISKAEKKCRIPLPEFAICALAAAICHFLKTDYAILAPVLAAVLYVFRDNNEVRFTLAALTVIITGSGATKTFGLLPLILIYFGYNGTKGINSRILNYSFYPVHLLLLYAVCMAVT